jgi:hypothetical protein
MPRFEQPAGLVFDAEDEEDAYAVEDDTLRALNEAAGQLDSRPRLHFAAGPPRELLMPPRVGVLVSASQAIAAAAAIYDGEDDAPVQIELAGSILNVIQGDASESYDIHGHAVEYPPVAEGLARATVVLTAGELKRAAAEAVAKGSERGVLLSQPIDRADGSRRSVQ